METIKLQMVLKRLSQGGGAIGGVKYRNIGRNIFEYRNIVTKDRKYRNIGIIKQGPVEVKTDYDTKLV